MVRRALLLLAALTAASAQDILPVFKNQTEADRALRQSFATALNRDAETALDLLPKAIAKPWIGEVNFFDACAVARTLEANAPDLMDRLVLAAGMHNPELAVREPGEYIDLRGGPRLFVQFVRAAPDAAMALASGPSHSGAAMRGLLERSGSPDLAMLSRLAADNTIDLPRRERAAVLAAHMPLEAALRTAQSTSQFFAAVLNLRTTHAEPALDRALENEALLLCRAAQQSLGGTLAELARFRARDLYAVLALGRAEATPEVFAAVFDRLLLPKWKNGAPLNAFLTETHEWELRDFAAGAVEAHRFDALVALAGRDLIGSLARGIDRADDPLKEAVRLAQILDATTNAALLDRMSTLVAEEYARCTAANDARGATLYGLLAARLSTQPVGAPYAPFLRSSETLDTAALFRDINCQPTADCRSADTDPDPTAPHPGPRPLTPGPYVCIQRHFFYDDPDGVESFESFRKTYQQDPAWTLEDRGDIVHLTGQAADGRRIEIFANVPIDTHQPANRALEGEAERRQQKITAALAQRGLVPSVIVHRGHTFWVDRTLAYLAKANRLVILGSCGGTVQVHAVLEASHDAQVIATRGIGTTAINDSILKAVNDRLLAGGVIEWRSFWRDLETRWGRSALFRDYVAPHQNSGTMLLRAYFELLDAAQ
jgi:hypothetical protein